jgi:hypothetical protein
MDLTFAAAAITIALVIIAALALFFVLRQP